MKFRQQNFNKFNGHCIINKKKNKFVMSISRDWCRSEGLKRPPTSGGEVQITDYLSYMDLFLLFIQTCPCFKGCSLLVLHFFTASIKTNANSKLPILFDLESRSDSCMYHNF